MKILVTGASGHFGGTAARLLLERVAPENLILMSRKPEKLEEFAKLGAKTVYGDFDDPDSLKEAATGADKMLLISGLKVGYRIKQHGNAITAARAAGVRHIIYTSYIGATAENTALIARDHYGTEELLKESGVNWTALRDGMYMDSMVEAAAPQALKSGRWVSSSRGGRTSFVDRDDCVACAVEVLTGEGHENKVYNITGPDLWSFPMIADLITEVTGKDIEFVDVSDEDLYAQFDSMGIPREPFKEFNINGYAWCSDDMVSYEKALRDGHFEVTSNDVQDLLGRPARDFRSFVLEKGDWLRQIAAEA
ncbi:SDR family oxidoreductase [Emcibacter sp.]|uniref:SDR family oxidoreductase n=1 Tax=Emcibacter sp. TaxID=1979954 RepID=UPI003A900C0D